MAVALLLGWFCNPGAIHRNRKVYRTVPDSNSTRVALLSRRDTSADLDRGFCSQATPSRECLMKHDWNLSQEDFDALLDWLDPDPNKAEIKYEDIRKRLVKIFAGRGCAEAEDLADETINRVTSRLHEIKDGFKG